MNENGNGPVDPTPVDPVNEAPVTTGEGVAERYVESELHKAKTSLLRTQIGCALAVLILGGYTVYLTQEFRKNLEPKSAATIAQGLVASKLEQGGAQFADYVKTEVPKYIRQAPDYAIKQLPEFRQNIERRVSESVKTYADQTSEQLGAQVDKFLDDNKDSVGALLKDGQDPAATAKINAELKAVFVRYLEEPGSGGGESVKSKLDQALSLLTTVEKRMARLATAKDLTPQEKTAKRAIAVLTKTIHQKRMEEGHEDAIAPKVINQASEAVKAGAGETAANVSNAANAAANAVNGKPGP